jgi:hypothetical protein
MKSKSPMRLLELRPNRFPAARFRDIRWRQDTQTVTESQTALQPPPPVDVQEAMEKRRNRFKQKTTT